MEESILVCAGLGWVAGSEGGDVFFALVVVEFGGWLRGGVIAFPFQVAIVEVGVVGGRVDGIGFAFRHGRSCCGKNDREEEGQSVES